MKRNDLSATKFHRIATWIIAATFAAMFSFGSGVPRVTAALFPPQGDDVMTSLGVFKVLVAPAYRSLLAPSGALVGYPGYVSADGRLTSPLLFDSSTRVGRSDPYGRAPLGPLDVGAPSMGLQGYVDYPFIPAAFSAAPLGTREILTRIRSLALRTTCTNSDPRVPHPPINYQMVSAGPDQGIAAKSVGMVQRLTNAPAGSDFPAKSFFDIFLEVNLPSLPGTVSGTAFPPLGAILYNDFPLVVTNLDLGALPPHVIYIHGETTAVPLKFRDGNLPYWNAGEIFGYVVLAGHGTQFDCPSEAGAFLDTVLGPIGGRPSNELPIEWPFPTDLCPPTNSTYDSVKEIDIIRFSAGTSLQVQAKNFSHGRLDNPIVPPPLNGGATYSDPSTEVMLEFSLNNGPWTMALANGGVAVRINHTADMGDLRLFDTEMLSLNLSGNTPVGPFMLRESPTRQSPGKHMFRDTGGDYRISGFFDVILELSVDGGVNWIPADRPIRVQLTPGCETNAPKVLSVTADCDANTISVQFSESMDPVSTTDPGRYSVIPGVTVLSVALNASGDVAVLATTDLFCEKSYELLIRSVADKCGNVIAPNPTIVSITCPPCKVSKWSQLPGFIAPPGIDPNRRGGDRPSDFDWVTLMESGTTATEPNWVIAEDFRSDGRPILCVRWWGSYLPGYEPGTTTAGGIANTFFEDGYVLSFFTSTPPGGAPSRPDQLLGTYVAPLESIKITPTRFIGCDSNRIWQYEVKLKDTCLEHADPRIATPRAFLEVSNVVYWLAITAEVGHRIFPLIDPAGNVVKWEGEPSGKRAKEHFWGWHTSPRNALNPSSMSQVFMQGEEWIYALWRSNFQDPLCNDIAQAFELLTTQPPCETNPPTVISVAIDCDNDKITVTYSEAMEPSTVGDPGNYALGGGVNINSIVLNADASVACLYTKDLKCEGTYTLTIFDVTDVCRNEIDEIIPNPETFTLACPPCPEPKVAKWSQLPGFLTPGAAGGNFRGADRPSDFDWTALMQSGTALSHPNWVIAEDFRSDGRPILCVRWWGSYMPGFEPTSPTLTAAIPPSFFEDGYVLSFFTSVQPVGPGASSRPGQLLGTYIAPLSAIKITPTQFYGCDSNRIWQYEVKLEDTCLDHADPRIARPDAFLEVSNVLYWVAITAEVGHQVIRITDAAGNVDWRHQPTGKRADRHFWGWHTSPRQVEDRSVMGHVFMQGTEWIYPITQWMVNPVVCNEVDQAFELLTGRPPPCETNRPTVISVTANCDSNKITVIYSEAMESSAASSPANYFVINLSGGPAVTVLSATITADGQTVCLFTTPLECDDTYSLSISTNVTDLCGNHLPQTIDGYFFRCPPCPQPKVAKWSQLPGYLTSTTNPHRRGADRPSDFDWNLIMQSPGTIIQPNWVIADDFLSDGRPILCVRWWGSYFKGYEPVTTGAAGQQFFEDGYVLSFFSGFIGGINRPEKLLGTYVAPLESVKITPTPFFGCDSNRIWQYEVALKDTCLDHRFASIARPTAFLERSNDYYFLAITAEVGHRVTPLRNTHGQIVDWVQKSTDKRTQEHFWGWHTSPNTRLDVSVMGNVLMEGDDWIYTRWGRNEPVCNEIDQAFELLTGPILCPPPATLSIVRSGNDVVISWVGDFTLQGTPELTCDPNMCSQSPNIQWSDITTTSPAILPILFTQHRFFRLICP